MTVHSYMIAMLTVSGSQAICAALQTKLDISGIKQHLLKHFLTPGSQGIQLVIVHYDERYFFIDIESYVIKNQ